MKRIAFITALVSFCLPVFASPTIDGLTVSTTPAKAGQPVSVTINAADAESGVCGLGIKWGDNSLQDPIKVGGGRHQTFPITLQHTYAQPGDYKIKVEGERVQSYLGCLGKATLIVKIESAAPPAAVAPACPTNWVMKGKPAKNGSFTCTPKSKGATKPEKEIACPAGTGYFYGSKALGCEKAQ